MSGRGAGYCVGYDAPGWASPIPGRGLGLGWGRGGGWRHRNWYYATGVPGWGRFSYAPGWEAPLAVPWGPYAAAPSREQEAEFLKQQADSLKQQLDAIDTRIKELSEQD
jgi:hypothetical protein